MNKSPFRPGAHLGQALLTFRIIGASLGLGVTLFAFVSWFFHLEDGGGMAADVALDPALLFNAMLGVAFLAAIAAIAFWRGRVAPLIEAARADSDPATRFAEIQTNVIITWAIMELPAMFAVVVYFLFGNVVAGVIGVALIWAAVGATWPRRDWFGQSARTF